MGKGAAARHVLSRPLPLAGQAWVRPGPLALAERPRTRTRTRTRPPRPPPLQQRLELVIALIHGRGPSQHNVTTMPCRALCQSALRQRLDCALGLCRVSSRRCVCPPGISVARSSSVVPVSRSRRAFCPEFQRLGLCRRGFLSWASSFDVTVSLAGTP